MPAELQKQQQQNHRKDNNKTVKGDRPKSDCRDDEDPGDMKLDEG